MVFSFSKSFLGALVSSSLYSALPSSAITFQQSGEAVSIRCDTGSDGSQIQQLSTSIRTADGKTLAATVDASTLPSGNATLSKSSLRLTLDGQLVLLHEMSGSGNTVGTNQNVIQLGSAAYDNPATVKYSYDKDVITGTFNGIPFTTTGGDRASLAPIYKNDSTVSTLRAKISKENIQTLQNRFRNAPKTCPTLANHTIPSIPLLNTRGLNRKQDPGHRDNMLDYAPCATCLIEAQLGFLLADGACLAACWVTFGVGCVPCYIAATSAYFTASFACMNSQKCCPVECKGMPFGCCLPGDSCLNPHENLCCLPGKKACASKSCCDSDQACIESGSQQGTCCPLGTSICGGKCCPGDGNVCTNNGQDCCAKERACGDKCCTGDFQYCSNASKGLCCMTGSKDTDGICCSDGQINCAGSCCAGTCSANGKCTPTTDACTKLTGGATCSKTKSCPVGWNCDEGIGCCTFIPT